jgi:hypothetical protein
LTLTERAQISAKVDELRRVSEADDGTENRRARLGIVANMLLAYPMAGASEEAGKARAGAYLAALDDIPAWAIAEAVRRWHRGECGAERNYRFAPAPAELRQVASDLLRPARDTVAHLERVLAALTLEQAMDPSYQAPGKPGVNVPKLRSV